MKNIRTTFILLIAMLPIFLFGQSRIQWSDDFSDGDFTNNPSWGGMTENFIVNSSGQLQSDVSDASKSYLSTPSEVFSDAVWEFWVKVDYNPSSSNFSIVYIVSDRADVSGDVNGYYVQIGNTADEISLYKQQGSKKTKIIDGADKILDTQPNIVKIKVTRSKEGEFKLYRQRLSPAEGFSDEDYVLEGSVVDNDIQGSKYFAVYFSNSKTTGKLYYFDDIQAEGERMVDDIPPVWNTLSIVNMNTLLLEFSEPVDISSAIFDVDNGIGNPSQVSLSTDKTKVTLKFSNSFERGKIYRVEVLNLTDLAGNFLLNTVKEIGIFEEPAVGDIIINEILFDNSAETAEYIEVYNRSNKVIDMSTVFFGVRTATPFKASNYFPNKSFMLPQTYMAITTDADLVRSYYDAPEEANILEVEKWSALNNSSANLLIGLVGVANDTLFLDEVTYDAKWHHSLIRNTKNVSLERINVDLPSNDARSWHSAATTVNYGTPGYKNSQHTDIISDDFANEKWLSIEPEVFSPDNDGIDDISFIKYKTDDTGYVGNVFIFNAVGSLVKVIAQNALLSSEGYFSWDGLTDSNKNVNPGVYVVYFEMLNNEKGVKKVEKLPIVVSAR